MGEVGKLISKLHNRSYLKLVELQKMLENGDESVSIIRLEQEEEFSGALKRMKAESKNLHQILRENEALVMTDRDGTKEVYLAQRSKFATKSSDVLVFELPEGCNPIQQGDKIPVKQLVVQLGLQECIIVSDDGERLIVWKVTKYSTAQIVAVHTQGMQDDRKSKVLQAATKGYSNRKFCCIVNQNNTWISPALEKLNINATIFSAGDANINPLERVVSRYDFFATTRIYSEVKILTYFFSQLDQSKGTAAVGLERTAAAHNSQWIKCWVVSEKLSHDVIQFRRNKEITVVFVGKNQPVPDQFQDYVFVSRSSILEWLREFDEVLMVSGLTDQGTRLESDHEGIGAILKAPYEFLA